MICDVLEEHNFNLISLSQQKIEEVSNLISQYRKKKIINKILNKILIKQLNSLFEK